MSVRQVPGTQLTGKVENLVERDQYQFRVKAVNKAGPGAASDPIEYHTVKHRKREYKPGVQLYGSTVTVVIGINGRL